jgi:hypothetical protein
MESKKWYLSKTLWIGVLTIVISILMLVSQFLTAGNFDPASIVSLVSGGLMVILRFLSNTSIN